MTALVPSKTTFKDEVLSNQTYFLESVLYNGFCVFRDGVFSDSSNLQRRRVSTSTFKDDILLDISSSDIPVLTMAAHETFWSCLCIDYGL